MTVPSFNVEGITPAAYCKEHAEDDMVNVCIKRCSRTSCTMRPDFNFEGKKTAVYCKKHAEEGMVRVRRFYCLYDSCMRVPLSLIHI